MVNNIKPVFPVYQITELIFDWDLSSSEKLLAIALLRFYNKRTGLCFPGIRTLAECTSMTKKTVLTTINKLIEKGLITVEKGSRIKPNYYNLLYIRWCKIEPQPTPQGIPQPTP
jgi:DNA-binding MarR family transcriptional regulator